MSSINFVLTAFESSVTMDICGNLFTEPIPPLDVSATAIIYVDRAVMRNIFQYRTDATDVIDSSLSDLKYFTFSNYWRDEVDAVNDDTNYMNPANAMMFGLPSPYTTSNEITSTDKLGNTYANNKRLVAHDFTRYLAQCLFNTAFGVDLFNNEAELLQSLRSRCGYQLQPDGALYQITDKIHNVDASNTNALLTHVDPVSGLYCMTNSDVGETNLCRTLFNQMMGKEPQRFSNIDASDGIVNTNPYSVYDLRPLPFSEGDTIEYKLIIAPAANQHLLTGVSPIDARSYRILLYLTDSVGTAPTVNVAQIVGEGGIDAGELP
jgi:hypothetical protein